MKKQNIKKLLFLVGFLGILLFFIWTNLILISFILILIVDSWSIQYFSKFFEKKIPQTTFSVLKYAYYLITPIILIIILRTFFFDIYYVPSSSMEKTLFSSDYVIINKVTYGTKVPKSIEDVPVFESFFKKNGALLNYDLYTQLKANKKFKREDVVVFKSTVKNNTFFIKRIIGLPNDTIKIVDSKVFINKTLLKEKETYCFNYKIKRKIKQLSNKEVKFLNTKIERQIMKEYSQKSFLFPNTIAINNNWTRDNYGDLIIPKKGVTIELNINNISIYKGILSHFENKTFELSPDETKAYTFKNNYYFMMGDNRHNSNDSRNFGFIPESYIQGKMIGVFSKKRLVNLFF